MRIRAALTASLLSLALAGAAEAQTGTLDQQSPFANVSYNGALTTLVWQQTVWTGVPGLLEGFELELQSPTPHDTINIKVYDEEAWSSATPVWTGTATIGTYTNTWHRVFVDVSSGGLVLNVNEPFTIELSGTGGYMGFRGQTTQPYPGDLYLNGVIDNTDVGFNTYMLPVPGPTIAVSNLVAGQTGTFTVSNASPNGPIIAGYSLLGGGPTPSAFGDILLSPPWTRLPAITTDAAGAASLSGPVPPPLSGTPVWFHALDVLSGTLTNGLAEVIG